MRSRQVHLLTISLCVSVAFIARADEPDWAALPYTPHFAYQAVNEYGEGTFSTVDPVKMQGVVINYGSDLLDPTPGANPFMGGQWQVYFQAVGDDWGGTACWMGEKLGNIWGDPNLSYTPEQWLAEIYRLEHDPATGYAFQPGDLVEVRARAPGMFYRGKTNINEKHRNDPALDFDIVLLAAGYGLTPTPISLADVKDAGDQFIFDQARTTGAERYQGSLVEIGNVSFVSTAGWGPNVGLTIQDEDGHTLPVLLGRGDGFSTEPPPAGPVDLLGIFDQEDASNPYTGSYRLWIPDSIGYILPLLCRGDCNCDGHVGFADIDLFVAAIPDNRTNWEAKYQYYYGATPPEGCWRNTDVNGTGTHCGFDDIDAFVDLIPSECP